MTTRSNESVINGRAVFVTGLSGRSAAAHTTKGRAFGASTILLGRQTRIKETDMVDQNYFKQGQVDCKNYYTSPAYAGLTRFIKAEDAIKIFWPPVDEMNTQIAMPLPKPRQKWMAGFKNEQTVITTPTGELGK